MKKYILVSLGLLVVLLGNSCKQKIQIEEVYASETLVIQKIAENSYMHISYLDTERYGKVPCNGAIFTDDNETVVFETPINDAVSEELIEWIENDLNARINAVVVSHFHEDALGGLGVFHNKRIASFANEATIDIVKDLGGEVPKYGITSVYEHHVGKQKVISLFVGEGHTKDIIVGYYPTDKVLFGGCLIKEIGAGPGNLDDANVDDWSQTVTELNVLTSGAEVVIPGHGKVGGQDLLKYTIKLFGDLKKQGKGT